MRILGPSAVAAVIALASTSAYAHGFAGARFFPATILIEDPFVADELALPTYTHRKGGEEPGVTEDEFEAEFSKRITSNFALSIEGGWSHESDGADHAEGWGNIEIGAKYQVLKIDEDEFVLSVGLEAELGGTGSEHLEVEGFNTYTPAIYFGKGLGTLPASMDLLRPIAVTGFGGVGIPDENDEASHLVYGLAIEYSLPYLHANVRDIGLPEWLNQVTPLVEMSFSTPLDYGDGEPTTGTINPGLIWSGKSIQIAAEAVIPINRESGDTVGFMAQLHFYLDDIFPDSVGTPVFK